MSAPKRIQRRRHKGWRQPIMAVYVGRPTRWSNRYKIGNPHPSHGFPMSRQEAVDLFAADIAARRETPAWPAYEYALYRYLKGHDLVCWCPLDQPCHADVLLELANP